MKHGFLKIDKPENYTSRDIDSIAKKTFDMRRVGHLGTLDPFATGLLLVGLGDGTKALPYIDDKEKEYLATLKLFSMTDTLDNTGKIIESQPTRNISEEEIRKVLSSFLGIQEQIPPLYSAKHIDGRRAYDLARSGQDVSLEPIKVDVKKCELISYDKEAFLLTFKAVVSKGTYIRSLGRDIAYRLNTIGYLTSLRRLRIGEITLDGAIQISDLNEKSILPLIDLLPQFPIFQAYGKVAKMVHDGVKLYLKGQSAKQVAVIADGRLAAIYQRDGSKYICLKGFHYEDRES